MDRECTKLKPVIWIGSSLKDLKIMPEDVIKDIGHSLREIQKGRNPANVKPLKHLKESSVWEIVVDEQDGTFRAIYTIEFPEAIAVLHVFQKKSKSGIKTPRQDIDLALERLKLAKLKYKEWKAKK